MKDIENVVTTAIKAAVTAEYSGALVTGEYSSSTKQFPCIAVNEIHNTPFYRALDLNNQEHLSVVEYEIEIFTTGSSKKTDGKAIREIVDTVMQGMYFVRTFCEAIPNADITIRRQILRYRKLI